MAGKEFPLSLLIKAVDRATEPLRRVNKRIQDMTAPVRRLNNSFRALAQEAGLPRLVQGFRGVGAAVGRVGREAWALGKRLALMATAATYALYRITRSTIKVGDDLSTIADRTGFTVDAFAQLRFAAAQADVEQEQFAKGMDYFNKTLGEAKAGTGALTTLLNKVSPALLRQLKGTKNAEEGLSLMIAAMQRIEDPTRRAALAAAAFGRSGQQIGVWLSRGTEEIEEQRKKFFELMGSQEAFAKQSAELDNTLRETEMAFSGMRFALAAGLFPAFRELAQELTRFLVAHRAGITRWAKESGAAIMAWVKGGGLTRLGESLRSIAGSIGKVVEMLGGLKGIAIVMGAVLGGKLLVSVLSLGGALWNLGAAVIPVLTRAAMLLWPVLAKIGAAMIPAIVAAGPVLIALGLLATAAFLIYKNWKYFKLFWQFNVVEPVTTAADAIAEAWGGVKDFFSGLWDSIVGVFTTAWAKLEPIVNAMRAVADVFTNPLKAISTAGKFYKDLIMDPENRPVLGAERAAAPERAGRSEAHVSVDFNGLPRGARVTPDSRNTAPLDLNLGYSMITP
jgi:hypothetical protein